MNDVANAKLEAAVRRRFGQSARIENVEITTLGGSNRTLIFDLADGTARRRLVSRQETYVAEGSPFLSTANQFRVTSTVFAKGLPVPEPLFEYDREDGMGSGSVSAYVAGETSPKKIQQACAESSSGDALAIQLGELIGRLHILETADFKFLASIKDTLDPIAAQRDRYQSYGVIRPAIDFGLRWLERNLPQSRQSVLVHGDYRLGNFMYAQGRVVALLDWECTHLGSGTEDIGWLCTRSWRFGRPDLPLAGIAQRERFLAAYRDVTGISVDAAELHYWEVFGLLRWAILNIMQAEGHVSGQRRGVVYAACGRNTSLVEYDLMMTLAGKYQ